MYIFYTYIYIYIYIDFWYIHSYSWYIRPPSPSISHNNGFPTRMGVKLCRHRWLIESKSTSCPSREGPAVHGMRYTPRLILHGNSSPLIVFFRMIPCWCSLMLCDVSWCFFLVDLGLGTWRPARGHLKISDTWEIIDVLFILEAMVLIQSNHFWWEESCLV